MNKNGGHTTDVKFVADAMLGALARWLRVLGYDTHYRSRYRTGDLGLLVAGGRHLLSRHRKTVERFASAVMITDDHVGTQLAEVGETLNLQPDPTRWFSRCLVCNTPLEEAAFDEACESVPEYVFYQAAPEIRFCPSCHRFFWPGSHRERMLRQLREWGFTRAAVS